MQTATQKIGEKPPCGHTSLTPAEYRNVYFPYFRESAIGGECRIIICGRGLQRSYVIIIKDMALNVHNHCRIISSNGGVEVFFMKQIPLVPSTEKEISFRDGLNVIEITLQK